MDTGRWVEVDDRVWVRRCAELDQSLGLVVGEERCLVVDTGTDDVHGAAWAEAVRHLTTLPWSVVVTHAHWDHFFGTSAFQPCAVWAHPRCRRAVETSAEEQRAEWVECYREQGKEVAADRLAAATLVLPNHDVPHQVELDLGGRHVELCHLGRGHTDNDIVVHVPDAKVVFAGDLVEQGAPPSIGPDSVLPEWPSTLDAVIEMRTRLVVPGHGDPVANAFVARQRDELKQLADLVAAVHAGELSMEDALHRSPYPEEYTRPAFPSSV
ncbi:MBL fold metallo-hydrolase [Longimycelium tulufanense]|uniref:MBL fold metallo-hydrolase n=1 Tax=Longimycelium tulufanense TaxID=907463 RepID=A0A8J3CGG1_9PSEU|nr:MBL fold metallo-hydrolase [Longimycelium tulufanense]GGM63840.1 MBL fold metallo-hydrolase [Longimycelium tulufanense]